MPPPANRSEAFIRALADTPIFAEFNNRELAELASTAFHKSVYMIGEDGSAHDASGH